jgi:E3 ubiquitin-protein ligase UBR7
VHSEKPAEGNKYNQNFRNRFCGCAQDYDPHEEKGTMFQCIGLGTVEDGGCGEDWWHPECLIGLSRDWNKKDAPAEEPQTGPPVTTNGESNGEANGDATFPDAPAEGVSMELPQIAESEVTNGIPGSNINGDITILDAPVEDEHIEDDPPLPPGFPEEESFEHFVCYKCVEAFPWIKRYAGTEGFLRAVYQKPELNALTEAAAEAGAPLPSTEETKPETVEAPAPPAASRKRKASEEPSESNPTDSSSIKRQRSSSNSPKDEAEHTSLAPPTCIYEKLPQPSTESISLFVKEDFRLHLCRCPNHFSLLTPHPALLEEEETYEPPISEPSLHDSNGGGSLGSRSLLDRGEAALSNIDRVRAIEGVMVYNHLREKVKGFLKPFAESGQAVGAEDIKAYFESLRGDAEGIKAMAAMRKDDEGSGGSGNSRKEQGGY